MYVFPAANSIRDGSHSGVGPALAHGGVARLPRAGRAGGGHARGHLAPRRQADERARGRSPGSVEHARAAPLLALLPAR